MTRTSPENLSRAMRAGHLDRGNRTCTRLCGCPPIRPMAVWPGRSLARAASGRRCGLDRRISPSASDSWPLCCRTRVRSPTRSGPVAPTPRQPPPRSALNCIAHGTAGNPTHAATTQLAQWLEEDYGLSRSEVPLILGFAIRYDIAEVVDPHVHLVAKVKKSALSQLEQNK
jgi:hypothetical protein